MFLLVFHQLLPLTFFRGTNIFTWRYNTLQHTDSVESRNRSLSVSLRKTPVCSLNKQTCWRLMHKQKKLDLMAGLCLSFDIHHFEIELMTGLCLSHSEKSVLFRPRVSKMPRPCGGTLATSIPRQHPNRGKRRWAAVPTFGWCPTFDVSSIWMFLKFAFSLDLDVLSVWMFPDFGCSLDLNGP